MLLIAFARPLLARWREPVFRFPILVLESDDWGAGPVTQAEALVRILAVLRPFHDAVGRPPVFTLGVVFEVPDTERLAAEGLSTYRARDLGNECFAALREVIRSGIEERIFVPHLHAQCHYRPDALLRVAGVDSDVRAWLTQRGLPRTEDLPPHLQSSWVDVSALPSRFLARAEIDAAVAREASSFLHHFGVPPCVVVPTTFVWNADVEQAWSAIGVQVIISPGRRATARDADGQPAGVDRTMLAGERSDAGPCYLVRDVYFEPALGHTPERLLLGLKERTAQGRPCLVEIHRFNFLELGEESFAALHDAMGRALASFPTLRFVAPCDLGQAILRRDPALLETNRLLRMRAWLARLGEIRRFGKLARITGLAIPLGLLGRVLSA